MARAVAENIEVDVIHRGYSKYSFEDYLRHLIGVLALIDFGHYRPVEDVSFLSRCPHLAEAPLVRRNIFVVDETTAAGTISEYTIYDYVKDPSLEGEYPDNPLRELGHRDYSLEEVLASLLPESLR